MVTSFTAWCLAGPLIAAFFVRRSKVSPVERDLEALLARMRRRLYPETIPALASYWLKTVYAGGHEFRWWKSLNDLLKRALREQVLNDPSRQAIIEIQTWIQQNVLLTGQTPPSLPPRPEPVRANPGPERLAPYIARLLNEWLPVEVARLLVNESESGVQEQEDAGIPVLEIGRALERLLVRDRLSPGALEALLQPELLTPQYVYPADAEILGDVILSLLGRTWAQPPPIMPATLLCVAPDSPLPADYREAVRHAFLAPQPGGEHVHVPVAPAQALEILKGDPVRIGSVVVTMDGRWWQSESLQSGEPYSVVHLPMGRLRIDYSADHAKLRVPWPETQLRWSGSVYVRPTLEIFGREWRVSQWETGAEGTWLNLVFSRILPIGDIAADTPLRRSRPAYVDMAWAALENAVTSSIAQKSLEPIEKLSHSDLIPLGRAIFGLEESVAGRRLQSSEKIETRLRAIRYLEAQVSSVYGLVPWRVLPAPVRAFLLHVRRYPTLLELLNQVFESLPNDLRATSQSPRSGNVPRLTSPPHAA